jgi:hypothetical protein
MKGLLLPIVWIFFYPSSEETILPMTVSYMNYDGFLYTFFGNIFLSYISLIMISLENEIVTSFLALVMATNASLLSSSSPY